MIDHRKLLVTAITVSLIGVCALFFVSSSIEPRHVALADIGDDDVGTVVVTNGTISRSRVLSDGSLSMSISDFAAGTGIDVYFPAEEFSSWEGGDLTPGTVVEVEGEVVVYGDGLEITISGAEDVKVLRNSSEVIYELGQIMDSLELMDGLALTTTGTVRNLEVMVSSNEVIGTVFELVGDTGAGTVSLDCIFFGQDLSTSFDNGDGVTVTGELGFYRKGGVWQLVLTDIE